MDHGKNCTNWAPLKDDNELKLNLGSYCILILNRPISIKPDFLRRLWNEAGWRITVDGGTDRWLGFAKKNCLDTPPPDAVSGDFDSITPETLEHCKKLGLHVEETPDQNDTDFTKALCVVKKTCPVKLDSVLVIMETCGRLDQIFSVVNTVHNTSQPTTYVLSSNSLFWILHPGTHAIEISNRLIEKAEWCGLLPLHGATVTTSGLKWNLDNQRLEFGGIISCSNTYDGSPTVRIRTDSAIIWTMGLGNDEDEIAPSNGY